MKKILVTGAAGFIGMHACQSFSKNGYDVTGIDNLNDYYEPQLKYDRLNTIGIDYNNDAKDDFITSKIYPSLKFKKIDICDKDSLIDLFESEKFDYVLHLAAQAGVQYSRQNPDIYIKTNIDGFFNVLDSARITGVKNFLYASSSSVYGKNDKYPYSEEDKTETPLSLYAATKKSDELIAYVYSETYGMHLTGLRFFTVYGPWGRPDMAPFIFTKSVIEDKTINLNNNGEMWRDFTYIDDIIDAILLIIKKDPDSQFLYRIYNVGNNNPEKVGDLLNIVEDLLSKKSIKVNKEATTERKSGV